MHAVANKKIVETFEGVTLTLSKHEAECLIDIVGDICPGNNPNGKIISELYDCLGKAGITNCVRGGRTPHLRFKQRDAELV